MVWVYEGGCPRCLMLMSKGVSPPPLVVDVGLGTLSVCCSNTSGILGSDLRLYSGNLERLSRFHLVVGSCLLPFCLLGSSKKIDTLVDDDELLLSAFEISG